MRTYFSTLFIIFGLSTTWCQEVAPLEYPGDNFSLAGALTVFKKAATLEQFEHLLNNRNSYVNNLDLNNDGAIDYINVEDVKNGNSHVLVLSTYLTEIEKQEIATVSIDKLGEAEAVVQIEGDQDLYAANTILEPTEEKEILPEGTKGPSMAAIDVESVLINVWAWPCVHFIYSASYVLWISPYRWNYYPYRWNPWRPFAYSLFYLRCAPHRTLFRYLGSRRSVAAKAYYLSHRHASSLLSHPHLRPGIIAKSYKVAPTRRIPVRTISRRSSLLNGFGIKKGGRR